MKIIGNKADMKKDGTHIFVVIMSLKEKENGKREKDERYYILVYHTIEIDLLVNNSHVGIYNICYSQNTNCVNILGEIECKSL